MAADLSAQTSSTQSLLADAAMAANHREKSTMEGSSSMTIQRIILGIWILSSTLVACAPVARLPDAASGESRGTDGAPEARQATPLPHRARLETAAIQEDLEDVMAEVQSNRAGEVYAAAVEGTDPEDLAIAIALVDGRHFEAGNAASRFPLMSVSKPFTYALAIEHRGADFMVDTVGVNATGMPYNSVAAGAVRGSSEQNPMVNAGAIATHSYIGDGDSSNRIGAVLDLYSRMANQTLSVEEKWRVDPRALTYTLAYQMKAADRLEGDVRDTVNRYLLSNIVAVDAESLAQMGATLASGGVQPSSGQRVLLRATVQSVLSAMTIAGMYQDSGRWWVEVGVPSKSGVSGAILAVVPGWGAIVAYSPRLDEAGNSVRGAMAIERLVKRWQLHSIDRLLTELQAVEGRL